MAKKAKSAVNDQPGGFLKKYRRGTGEEYRYIPLSAGHLRLEYGDDAIPLLTRVAFVADPSEHSPAIGNCLELNLSPDELDEAATFIAEEGVSGTQWSGGAVQWGHTYDDDTPPVKGRVIALEDWVDECVATMINPPGSILQEMKRPFDLQGIIAKIKKGDDKSRDRFWKKCTPRTGEEAALVLELLEEAAAADDGDVLFTCADPLKRAAAGHDLILDRVTALLEGESVKRDYDRSELQEILAAHGTRATPELIGRWIRLVENSLKAHGAAALHAINAGPLISALARAPRDERILAFFEIIHSTVENAPEQVRGDVQGLQCYGSIKKTLHKR